MVGGVEWGGCCGLLWVVVGLGSVLRKIQNSIICENKNLDFFDVTPETKLYFDSIFGGNFSFFRVYCAVGPNLES